LRNYKYLHEEDVAVSNRKLGFGIIGCGMISSWHAGAIEQIDGAILKGVTDINKNSRESFAGKFNASAFDSVEELLKCEEIDVVCVCTPSGLHAPLAIQVANAGRHIIIEKPMALNLKEAKEIIEACEKNNVKMAVISQLRFSKSVQQVKAAVENGVLGKIVMGDVYMKYYRSQEYYNNGGWRGTWKMDGGGALMNQGIHGIDLLQYIMGPVKTVFAHAKTLARSIEVEDTAAAVIEFENGALGVIQGTTSIYPGSPRRIEINGDKGTIVLEEDCISQWVVEGQDVPADVVIGKTTSGASSNPGAFSLEGHIKQISDMVDAVNNNRKPLVDQYEGRKAIEIIMAVYESSKSGEKICLAK
jgi:UDP-N-acetyl-2-amino-2-deoxyglucuronate dehydrogenase